MPSHPDSLIDTLAELRGIDLYAGDGHYHAAGTHDAPIKGRQVLYVWDCAGTDMRQWCKWKQAAGVYFLSRAKDLMKITCFGEIEFDREDPINAGVLDDQHAAT
jgi:hypothetical protein